MNGGIFAMKACDGCPISCFNYASRGPELPSARVHWYPLTRETKDLRKIKLISFSNFFILEKTFLFYLKNAGDTAFLPMSRGFCRRRWGYGGFAVSILIWPRQI
jgi:hypothetical protein